MAALLAARLARRGPTVLVDTGPGPSLDTALGIEDQPGLRWPDLTGAIGAVDPDQLAGTLLRWDRCAVLPTDDARPGPPPAAVLPDVLDALADAHRSVVLDLDRSAVLAARAGPPGVEDALHRACDSVLVVTPRDVPGTAGARLLRDVLVDDGRRVALVVRGPAPGGLGGTEIGESVGLPVLATLPRARSVAAAVDRGAGPVAPAGLLRAVERLAARLVDLPRERRA
ncbi:pilus assembly protein FlpE [Cellulomonas sp. NPDC058312]|uniref:pilus assembly protein FlpE n=1 Tax=Cellulomonas sp. NPDC058312 TaxID=3346441 RepID=UPI0036EC7A12